MSGKGSKPRPYSVSLDNFDKNWSQIFGNKNEKDSKQINQADQPPQPGNLDVSGSNQDNNG